MRNTPLGDFRLTSALSARAVEIASEIGGVNNVHCPLRAREGAVSRPTRPSRRWRRADRAACAGCRRFPLRAFGAERPSPSFVLFTNLGSGLTMALGRTLDEAAERMRRPRRGRW